MCMYKGLPAANIKSIINALIIAYMYMYMELGAKEDLLTRCTCTHTI